MNPLKTKALGLALAGSLLATACGSDADTEAQQPPASEAMTTTTAVEAPETTEPAPPTADVMIASTDDGASTLRAGLTSLLQEHLYLAAITLETAVDAGGDLETPEVQAAIAVLDANSVDLANAVGSIAGDENGEAFLGLWREHIGFFVDYTLGRATGDDAKVEQAMADLTGYKQASAAFFEEITGGAVSAAQVEDVLAPHAVTTFAAIDALVAGEAETFTLVRVAGQEMPGIATALSGAIVTALPDNFSGDVNSVPAETRAVLTSLLQEHVYLAGIALEQAVEYGGDLEHPTVVAAVGALDENSVALSDVVASVAGDENGEAFLGLWREHIGFFVEYTLGRATGDDARADQARTDLDGYKQAAGAFFEEITAGELPADALVANLDGHTETVFATIDSLVAGDADIFANLRMAAMHMDGSANALATAIVAATS
ncbi:MAG: hypothetical protein HKN26_04495 [Acidimicrobiales bacterium]|nr:hypothetical protein [Acidimicrobiales bacterium]